jgi:hypothetical protein
LSRAVVVAGHGWDDVSTSLATWKRREVKTAFFADRRPKTPGMAFLAFETDDDDNDSGGCG